MRQMFCIKLTIVGCVIAKLCVLLMKFRSIEFMDTHARTCTHTYHDVSLMTGNTTDFGTALLL